MTTLTAITDFVITTLTEILSVFAKMAGKDRTAMKPFHACASAHLGNALMVRTRSIAPTALTTFLDENVNT